MMDDSDHLSPHAVGTDGPDVSTASPIQERAEHLEAVLLFAAELLEENTAPRHVSNVIAFMREELAPGKAQNRSSLLMLWQRTLSLRRLADQEVIGRYAEELRRLRMNALARKQGTARPCPHPRLSLINGCRRELERRGLPLPSVQMPEQEGEEDNAHA